MATPTSYCRGGSAIGAVHPPPTPLPRRPSTEKPLLSVWCSRLSNYVCSRRRVYYIVNYSWFGTPSSDTPTSIRIGIFALRRQSGGIFLPQWVGEFAQLPVLCVVFFPFIGLIPQLIHPFWPRALHVLVLEVTEDDFDPELPRRSTERDPGAARSNRRPNYDFADYARRNDPHRKVRFCCL